MPKVIPDRDAVVDRVQRSLSAPAASGLRRQVENSISTLPRVTPAGLYVGHREAITIDGQRLDRTAARIVRGLFFLEKGHPLPHDYGVNTVHLSRTREVGQVHPEFDLALRQFIAFVSTQPRKASGRTFAYQWAQSPNRVDNTIWLLSFYGRTEYFCSTFAMADVAGVTLEDEIARVRAIVPGEVSV